MPKALLKISIFYLFVLNLAVFYLIYNKILNYFFKEILLKHAKLKDKLLNFIKDERAKTPHQNFIIGISGGLDSAIVSALCAEISFKNTYGIILPTKTSSQQNRQDAIKHCDSFGIVYELVNIEPMISAYEDTVGILNNARRGNLAARLRMCVLYDTSFFMDGIVVGTSNLSERLLGYGTIYGDLACAFNPIGEIFKSELYDFASYLGISDAIINKAPSAELWPGQSDEKELGYTYAQLDKVLRAYYDDGKNFDEMRDEFDKKLVNFVQERVNRYKFKMRMPNIAQIRKHKD